MLRMAGRSTSCTASQFATFSRFVCLECVTGGVARVGRGIGFFCRTKSSDSVESRENISCYLVLSTLFMVPLHL